MLTQEEQYEYMMMEFKIHDESTEMLEVSNPFIDDLRSLSNNKEIGD